MLYKPLWGYMVMEREQEKISGERVTPRTHARDTKSSYVKVIFSIMITAKNQANKGILSKGRNASVYIEQLTADRATRTQGILGNAVRNKCADSFRVVE